MGGSWAGFGFVIYNQTTDLGQGPFTSSTELFKTLTQWKMLKVSKKEIFQESKEVIISIFNFCLFPLDPKMNLLLKALKTEPLLEITLLTRV